MKKQTHKLKTWKEYFSAVLDGSKTFEIRVNDRDFKVGDRLQLIEYSIVDDVYTGRSKQVDITYILQGGKFGIDPKYVVMGIKLI